MMACFEAVFLVIILGTAHSDRLLDSEGSKIAKIVSDDLKLGEFELGESEHHMAPIAKFLISTDSTTGVGNPRVPPPPGGGSQSTSSTTSTSTTSTPSSTFTSTTPTSTSSISSSPSSWTSTWVTPSSYPTTYDDDKDDDKPDSSSNTMLLLLIMKSNTVASSEKDYGKK
ncbi:cell wall integrity and stress response component 3-like isoform X1 [Pecten maximus]|uniref:cell wall integrity and stress response component 3-like isoform X1 n=1 Tax=Pecten maximus TaxID=6579 RepID=UPI0014589785|nr:cell wall integrity and stress response component 3-like isoform X1 [Pecten maximus]